MNINPFKNGKMAERVVTWGLPMMLIPALRFFQDSEKPEQMRKELFVRDFSSYAVGVGLYMLSFAALAGKKTANSLKPVIGGVLSFSVWSGALAPKFSKFLVENKIVPSTTLRGKEPFKPVAQKPNFMKNTNPYLQMYNSRYPNLRI